MDTAVDEDAAGVSCTLEAFVHDEEVQKLIQSLPNTYADARAMEIAIEQLTVILSLYQEQPHLLDRCLDNHLSQLVEMVRLPDSDLQLKVAAFKFIRLIINVRGYKVVVRHLPHEVADLEPVLTMLETTDNTVDWEMSYVLLLWLSIIVKIPFHMSRLDGADAGDNTVMKRIFRVCLQYLRSSQTVGAAAGYVTSCFLTRSDAVEACLSDFLSWSYLAMQPKEDRTAEEDRYFVAALMAVASILKHGKRDDLLPHAPTLLEKVLASNYKQSKNSLLRKNGMKVVQRIGLTFLKPKVASWRYQRGARSLAENLKSGPVQTSTPVAVEEDEDFDVPEQIEEVIEELMQGLKDPETVIRWSAAKGIGRITGRLPRDLAHEVVTTLVDTLSGREGDSTWHGVCLALAELGRRGLLLPQHLHQVLNLVQQALVYEDSRGYYAIGENVRDAACYVAWSFARAYDPTVLRPYVSALASGLITVALFDREVKCRKAAAAAFQEHVGRQGAFPHGIEIVTTADYYSVAVRHNAYVNISVIIGRFPEYTTPLIMHLIEKKVSHWDLAVRELTASALHELTPLAPSLMASDVLPELLTMATCSDVNARHGAILALGSVIHALSLISIPPSDDVTGDVAALVKIYQQKFYLQGMGGEMLRQAFCRLVENCAVSQFRIKDGSVVDAWQQLINECLLSEVAAIRQRAAAALTPFLTYYRAGISDTDRDALVDSYLRGLATGNQTTRIGLASALSALPLPILLPRAPDVVAALLDSLRITEGTLKWAEARRDGVTALVSIVINVGVAHICDPQVAFPHRMYQEWDASVATSVGNNTRLLPSDEETALKPLLTVFEALLVCLREYTQDARGDIGAWVREAAMTSLGKLVVVTAQWQQNAVSQDLLTRVMGAVGQQAVERIDRTRFLAGKIFSDLLHNQDPVLENIPHRGALLEIFPKEEVAWSSEAQTFPLFVQLLEFPCYTRPVLEGLIMSVGGLTERLVRHSSSSLFTYLKSVPSTAGRVRICDVIIAIFAHNLQDARVITPLFSFLDRLLGAGVIQDVMVAENGRFPAELLRLAKLEVSKTRDFKKLVANMDVFCQLVQVEGDISRRALCQMSVFLCNRLKAVRKAAANKLYECLLLYGDVSWVPDDNLDEAMSLISDTEWEQDVSVVRIARNKLCELMAVPVPSLVTPSAPAPSKT